VNGLDVIGAVHVPSPGHGCALHSLTSSGSPSQSSPRLAGAGLSHLRSRYERPPLQVAVQSLHAAHGPHSPSTMQGVIAQNSRSKVSHGHGSPPASPGVMSLVLVLWPPPHSAVHLLQSAHSCSTQSHGTMVQTTSLSWHVQFPQHDSPLSSSRSPSPSTSPRAKGAVPTLPRTPSAWGGLPHSSFHAVTVIAHSSGGVVTDVVLEVAGVVVTGRIVV
jgi:hypothetical protein